MNKLKAVFAIFFLLVFTFNVLIYYTLFEFNETQAKTEMGQSISRITSLSETETFTLPINRLNDMQHSEIWLNGKLYDIVKTEVRANSVVVYVLNDKKEEGLVTSMGAHTEGQSDTVLNTGKAKHSNKHSVKSQVQKYYPAAIISFRYDKNDRIISCVINCFYSTPIPSVLAPPPEPLS
jgi:hypothetical protein